MDTALRKKKAVSIQYDSHYPAPFVSARTEGELASAMIKLAEREGVPVMEIPALSEELFLLNPGDMIPESSFRIVAEILAFIYSVQDAQ
jgi:flagellar biosynthetic protein FlhB